MQMPVVYMKGHVTDYVILDGYPETGLDEAAITAIKRIRWKPAMQRDQVVGVRIAIPIEFKL